MNDDNKNKVVSIGETGTGTIGVDDGNPFDSLGPMKAMFEQVFGVIREQSDAKDASQLRHEIAMFVDRFIEKMPASIVGDRPAVEAYVRESVRLALLASKCIDDGEIPMVGPPVVGTSTR